MEDDLLLFFVLRQNKKDFVCNVSLRLIVIVKIRNMKTFCLMLGIISICFLGCKKESIGTFQNFNGNGFIYTDGDPGVWIGGIGWYFAESRVGQWKTFPLKESQLPAEFKNITIADSIPVTVSLRETKAPVGCDCPAGIYYYYDILSIRKR